MCEGSVGLVYLHLPGYEALVVLQPMCGPRRDLTLAVEVCAGAVKRGPNDSDAGAVAVQMIVQVAQTPNEGLNRPKTTSGQRGLVQALLTHLSRPSQDSAEADGAIGGSPPCSADARQVRPWSLLLKEPGPGIEPAHPVAVVARSRALDH